MDKDRKDLEKLSEKVAAQKTQLRDLRDKYRALPDCGRQLSIAITDLENVEYRLGLAIQELVE